MVFSFLGFVGALVYLYLVWRNLKDNYRTSDLVNFSWLSLLVFLLGGRITYGLANWGEWDFPDDWMMFYSKPGINLAGGYVVFLMLTVNLVQKYGWKIWSFLDDMTSNLIILVFGLWLAGVNFGKAGLKEGLIALIFIFCLWLSNWVSNKYRSFVWYRSGKKGFRFFFVSTMFFMLLSFLFLAIGYKLLFWSLMFVGLINLVGLFILGEVFDPLLIKLKRKRI